MRNFSIFAAAADNGPDWGLIFKDRRYSFRDLAQMTAPFVSFIDSLKPNELVALWASNDFNTVLMLYAMMATGTAFVPIHPRTTLEDANLLIRLAGVNEVFTDNRLTEIGNLSQSLSSSLPSHLTDDTRPMAVLFTSGSTGMPKGAVLSRRAFAASATGSALNLGWYHYDKWVLCLPMCHIGGLSVLTRCLWDRKCAILLSRFDPDAVLDAISRHGATLLSVVPTMLRALLKADTKGQLSRLRAVLLGGAQAPSDLLDECISRKVRVLTTYGLTEACSQVTVERIGDPFASPRGSGMPIEGVDLKIVDEGGQVLPSGKVGTICIRGPILMNGYLNESPIDEDKYFSTTDEGYMDTGGHLHVVGRKHHTIITGGENVYPVQVENTLRQLTSIHDAVVFGVDDPVWGQIVAAAVVLSDKDFDRSAFRRFLNERLSSHSRARKVVLVDNLPLMKNGKVDRAVLASKVMDQLEDI